MAQSAELGPKDRASIRALAGRMRVAGKHKPLLLTGRRAAAAAKAMTEELHLDIFHVDLSAIVSKFIGETEKNLEQVFVDADRAGSVLLFDEADALFGKRSEVKDAHDRFANIEVSYLLQRAEARRGLVILVSETQRPLPVTVRRRLLIRSCPPPRARTLRSAICSHT